jgi:hypothetical protein
MSVFQTGDKPRFDLVAASPAVRPHHIVLFADAPRQQRQHALEQIKRLMDEGDESAIAVLGQFSQLTTANPNGTRSTKITEATSL